MASVPDSKTATSAVASTAAAAAKRAAAPSWATIRSTFDKMGGRAEFNAKGQVVGYQYPKPKNDEQRKQINNAVYEMWHPHRRISTAQGMEKSARVPVTTLVDRATGKARQVREAVADKLGRKANLSTGRSSFTGGWLPNAKDRERERAEKAQGTARGGS